LPPPLLGPFPKAVGPHCLGNLSVNLGLLWKHLKVVVVESESGDRNLKFVDTQRFATGAVFCDIRGVVHSIHRSHSTIGVALKWVIKGKRHVLKSFEYFFLFLGFNFTNFKKNGQF
jgi:hypothetical protein